MPALRVCVAAAVLVGSVACVPVLETPNLEGPRSDEPWVAPENSWPLQEPPATTVGEGFHRGQVPHDFRFLDQHGDEVSLWQFHGRHVVLDISTMWCAPCRKLAEGTEETATEYADDDVVYITVLAENIEGAPATTEDLELWADLYGITAPIVADADKTWSAPAVPNGLYPVVFVLNPDLTIAERVNPASDERLHEVLDEQLAE